MRHLAGWFAASLAVGLAAACGSSDDNTAPTPDAGPKDASMHPVEAGPVVPMCPVFGGGATCGMGMTCCFDVTSALGGAGGALGGAGGALGGAGGALGGGAGGATPALPMGTCQAAGSCTGTVIQVQCAKASDCSGGQVCCMGAPCPDGGCSAMGGFLGGGLFGGGGAGDGGAAAGGEGGAGGILGGGAGGLLGNLTGILQGFSSVCQTSCMPGQTQLCAMDSECTGGGKCQVPGGTGGGGDAGAGAAGGIGGIGALFGGSSMMCVQPDAGAPAMDSGQAGDSGSEAGPDTGTIEGGGAGEAGPETGPTEGGSDATAPDASHD